LDYQKHHSDNIGESLRNLRASSAVIRNSSQTLLSLLSGKGLVYNLPHLVLPKFGKNLKAKKDILLGKHAGTISRELGRGAYGAVFLMEASSNNMASTLAVKAQSPIDCLAWEFDILRTIQARTKNKANNREPCPFPRPFSFIALADGAMMSMTAGSESGLNLVDLANMYRVKLGENVPEIVAFHYTSCMLKHVATLHESNVVHADIKPDNWVLFRSSDVDAVGVCEDLMLVDFGRAIDLEYLTQSKRVSFTGNASSKDMRCIPMRLGKQWLYEIDTYGILCSVHIMLFGSHMTLTQSKSGRWEMTSKFRRYWRQDLWKEVFDSLLIHTQEKTFTDNTSSSHVLHNLREQIEGYLKCEQSNLSAAMERQARFLPSSRNQL
jgi:checkpoint serine/threonine-protein kinase